MTLDPNKPLPEVIRIHEPGLLEMILKSQAGWSRVPPETARLQLELLWHSDAVFRAALQGLFRYVVDTLRVREARDEEIRQMHAWIERDWAERKRQLETKPPAGGMEQQRADGPC